VRIFSHYLHMPIVVLALVEALALMSLPYAAVLVRLETDIAWIEAAIGPIWPRALLLAMLVQFSMVATGLYSTRLRATFSGVVLRIVTSVCMATIAMVLLFYLFPQLLIGRGVMAYSAAGAFFVVVLVRFAYSRLVDETVFKRRVLVYGSGRQAMSISQLRRRADQRGFSIVGYIKPEGDREMVPSDHVLVREQSLLELARDQGVDEIVVAMDDRRRAFPVQELLECRLGGIEVLDLVSFLERETGKVRLDVLNPGWMIFSDGFRRDPLRLLSERAFDLLASAALLAITWPLMLLTMLAIKLEEGINAPVFYRQRRVGFEGCVFDVLKFRSMRLDAEPDGQPRWAQKGDERVTRVGSVIRKARIDELPQIINVLRGDMSFVGPRPERPEFVAELNEKIPYYRERHCVKPGITGWAQLCYPYGSSEHDAAEKLQYDLYYVKNRSLLFDLVILLQTAEVVIWGKGGR
jgi:sugar transferase (PEP-CTERM system associated)